MNKCSCGNLKDEKYIMCESCYFKKVEFEKICEWLNLLKNYWLNKDVEGIVKLFSNDCECYDTPFSTNGNIREDWAEIKTQEIKDISYKILMRKGYEFFVEFDIQYNGELCNAINHIKLNNDMKCTYLKQWYMCK